MYTEADRQKDIADFERLVNGEYYSQVENAGADGLLDGMRLAMLTIYGTWADCYMAALKYIYQYGNWQTIGLPPAALKQCQDWEKADGQEEKTMA
jgi:hypothetical protein